MKPTNEDIGRLVKYFKSGWYHGHLEKIEKKKIAVIRPIVIGKKKNCIHVSLENVEVVDGQ